ncbi:inorganic triphosphatase [Serratia symbiotica]|uniref:CYTH domain-containing protein n=1 Tax=Serratia symbiotica TaxID=138074 RepID=UPI00132A1448|nr:inorganic triphosphatase [Serratia symbiotica]MBF1994630.1 inorganic triphosphatase [Serratia symbiotica]MBQ0955707.1 inorganic triphosphatase [Serratia symbiotica]QTP14971.1 inorganic triphosphatase [Serratia symbiotica]
MTVEIELKLIATPAAVTALPQQLVAWPNQHATPQKLTNIYFETADNFLRSQDMGLRIRGFDDNYEMTLKTAGKVLVGLHQRPEYNVSIATPVLALEQFPAGIWPLGCDLTALQQVLQPLFRTDFMREKWVVTYGTSEIEVSLDQGEISAGELSEALCEIELELKQGHTADLLALANALAEHGGLRQGNLSKAARGYHLAQGNVAHERRQLRVLKPAAKSSVEQGMIASVELALSHWQYHEELWLGGDVQARRSVLEAIALIRQALVIFGGLVPRKASADLRARLTTLEPLLVDKTVQPQVLCYSAQYLQCKLALTSWLVTRAWRPFVGVKGQAKLDDSFKRFCDIMLGRSAAELKAAFNHTLNDDEYPEQLPRLTRHLLAFTLLSGAYPDEQTEPYLASWRELQLALAERRQSGYEASRKQALSHAPFWLNSAL